MRNLKILLTFLFLSIQINLIYSQNWELDLKNAMRTAQDSNKTVILVFSGSDWCAPCMKLEKEIWETENFQSYAQEHYVMVRADFPRRKANKLSKEQEVKNYALAEKYNANGYFPLVVVLDDEGNVLGETGYKKLSSEEYIHHLNSFIPSR